MKESGTKITMQKRTKAQTKCCNTNHKDVCDYFNEENFTENMADGVSYLEYSKAEQ